MANCYGGTCDAARGVSVGLARIVVQCTFAECSHTHIYSSVMFSCYCTVTLFMALYHNASLPSSSHCIIEEESREGYSGYVDQLSLGLLLAGPLS